MTIPALRNAIINRVADACKLTLLPDVARNITPKRPADSRAMKRYGNRSGNSGVAFFEDGPDYIKIQFGEADAFVYVYDDVAPGAADVAHMKTLAASGRGLSTYISQHVRDRYRRKEPSGS